MKYTTLGFKQTNQFSKLFLDYINQENCLDSCYENSPEISSFKNQITQKQHSFPLEQRQILVESLKLQYKKDSYLPIHTEKTIDDLSNKNTFTVTTGHQLNIYTGPLYFIFKIITTIRLAEDLKKHYPQYNFIPVYWMATEDHDYDEIRRINIFGKSFEWDKEPNSIGPVGKLNTKGLEKIAELIPDFPQEIIDIYQSSPTLTAATRKLVQHLFKDTPLVIIDGDDDLLKRQFIPSFEKEILETPSNDLINQLSNHLEQNGYKAQAFPRNINVFYMEDDLRSRIIFNDETKTYDVLNSDLSFSKKELIDLLHTSPNKFSPNVVLRPLYQESILPNLAYIGGPGELAYWLQLHQQFKYFQIPLPILFPRNFGLLLNTNTQKKIQQLGLPLENYFEEELALKERFLKKEGKQEFNLSEEDHEISAVFQSIVSRATAIDGSMEGFIMGELKKVQKGLSNMEKRVQKAEERKFETQLNKLAQTRNKILPNGTLQERKENIFSFLTNHPTLIQDLTTIIDPFKKDFYVVEI